EADRFFGSFESARTSGRSPMLPRIFHVAFVDELLQRMREYGAGAAELRKQLEERLSAAGTTVEGAVRAQHQRQAMGHVSMGNTITSLRLCATLDWNGYVEGVSLIEQILRRDPPGIYGRMDFTSRDRYRHAIEELAERTGEAQVRVALRAIESARQAAEQQGLESIAAHVGHHLIARGRRELEIDVAYYPVFKQRVRRALFARATPFYLGSIALLTALGAMLAATVARAAGARERERFWGTIIMLLPASAFAVERLLLLVHRIPKPRLLPTRDSRGRGHQGAQRALRSRRRGPILPVPSSAPLERQRRRLDGLGAQARQDRGIQSTVAGRHGHELRRADRRPRDPRSHPLLHHAR